MRAVHDWLRRFPRLYAAASLKPSIAGAGGSPVDRFSAALCRGLIEAAGRTDGSRLRPKFSAALCRGLIEARIAERIGDVSQGRFPRLYAAASLKHGGGCAVRAGPFAVFRGFMPRPH